MQFLNDGWRSIIDIEIVVRVALKGVKGTNDVAYQIIKTNASRIPKLDPGKSRKVRLFDQRRKPEFEDIPSEPIRTTILDAPTLNRILVEGSDAWITTHVYCYDWFGGSRKVYSSKNYRIGDIKDGTIRNLEVVNQ